MRAKVRDKYEKDYETLLFFKIYYLLYFSLNFKLISMDSIRYVQNIPCRYYDQINFDKT